MKSYKVTLTVEHYVEAEDSAEAEMLFWNIYHTDKKALSYEVEAEEGEEQ